MKVVITQDSPLVRGGSGDGQPVQDEVSQLQMRSEEGANRLALVEHYEMMKRFAAAGLWSDVEVTAGKVAVAWKALVRRGGEATVDRMLLRVRFVASFTRLTFVAPRERGAASLTLWLLPLSDSGARTLSLHQIRSTCFSSTTGNRVPFTTDGL